jgi:RNase P subunit RPR2
MSDNDNLASVTVTVECECGFKEVFTSKKAEYFQSLEASVDYPGDEDEQAVVLFNCPQCKKVYRVLP